MPRFFLVPPFRLGVVVVVVDDGTAEAVADLEDVDLGITDDFFGGIGTDGTTWLPPNPNCDRFMAASINAGVVNAAASAVASLGAVLDTN